MSKKRFKDTAGRQYKIKVTIPRLRLVRDELDIDLGRQDTFIALSINPIDLVNVLYLLVREQVDEHKLTDVEFGEALDGDTLEAAWAAFSEAYLDFCPSHQAMILRRLMTKAMQAERLGSHEIDSRMDILLESFKSDSKSAGVSELNRATFPLEN